jgi:hypothetical protein
MTLICVTDNDILELAIFLQTIDDNGILGIATFFPVTTEGLSQFKTLELNGEGGQPCVGLEVKWVGGGSGGESVVLAGTPEESGATATFVTSEFGSRALIRGLCCLFFCFVSACSVCLLLQLLFGTHRCLFVAQDSGAGAGLSRRLSVRRTDDRDWTRTKLHRRQLCVH